MARTILSSVELLHFVETQVPEFESPRLLGAGYGFHYTPFRALIERKGKLLGAPVNSKLHQTQDTSQARPAMHEPGVVFAYGSEAKCRHEGRFREIVRIRYRSAIEAMQRSERMYLQDLERRHGIPYPIAPTLLILTSDILEYSFLGTAEPNTG